MDLITPAISLISAIIGAIIGGRMSQIASLEAAREAHENNRKLQKETHDLAITNLKKALYSEISTMWESYSNKIAFQIDQIKPGIDAILLYYPITQEYFSIYNGNANMIGAIEDNELRKAIVTSYTKARTLIDSFRMNNELLQKYEYYNTLFSGTMTPNYGDMRTAALNNLVDYAQKLKTTHDEVKHEVTKLIAMFGERGIT